eukprot:750318-Hanusia_phi.AAC.2
MEDGTRMSGDEGEEGGEVEEQGSGGTGKAMRERFIQNEGLEATGERVAHVIQKYIIGSHFTSTFPRQTRRVKSAQQYKIRVLASIRRCSDSGASGQIAGSGLGEGGLCKECEMRRGRRKREREAGAGAGSKDRNRRKEEGGRRREEGEGRKEEGGRRRQGARGRWKEGR